MSLSAQIGGTYDIDVPDVDTWIANGYTDIRIYVGTSEGATFVLEGTTLTLVSGTFAYSYNKTTALATDWVQHAFYGSTPGESPRSEPVPFGSPQSTRKLIRQGVGRRLRLMFGPYFPSSVTDSDTLVVAELVDPDGMASLYANWFLRSGAQVRQIRASTSSPAGYVPSTGTLNTRRGFSPTLETTSALELWKSRANEDPSIMVDEAMNRARRNMWYEEALILTTNSSQSEYVLPRIIENKQQIKRVEYAMGNYPDEPQWANVMSSTVLAGGTPILSLAPGALTNLSAGTIIRVLVNRFPDRMDDETDYWSLPLEWAIAETALETVNVLGATTGQVDDVRDWRLLQQGLAQECYDYRATYFPTVEFILEPPR